MSDSVEVERRAFGAQLGAWRLPTVTNQLEASSERVKNRPTCPESVDNIGLLLTWVR